MNNYKKDKQTCDVISRTVTSMTKSTVSRSPRDYIFSPRKLHFATTLCMNEFYEIKKSATSVILAV